MKRAAEIAIYYSHTRPNGESCFTAYTVQRGARAENIAMGYPSADSVFEAWCENDENYSGQGHRRNMLGSYSYIGIGHVFFNGTHFWVQEFSTAPTDLTKSTAFDSNTVVTIEILDSLIEGSSYLLDSYDYNLKKGESDTLPKVYKTLTVPNGTVNVEEVQPTWSISDKKVATISGNKIKAVGGGKAKLTASYDNWTDYIFINVTAEVESITLNKTSLSLTVGDSEKLKATVLPADANDKSVYWYSNSSSIATVSSDGTVTAKKKGTVIITAYSSNGLEAECKVTVNEKTVSYPDGLNQTKDGWYLFENNKVKTSFTGLYEDAQYGWWLVQKGKVAVEYNDFYCDSVYGWWKIAGGSVDFGFTDFYNSPTYGWWKVNGGAVDFGFTDLYESPTYGWWKVNGGAVDFGFTDLYESPRYGWWKVNGGAVDFGFTDLYGSPVYGWWLVDGGMVDFSYNDIFKSPSYGYWKVAGGTVDFGYYGVYNSKKYGKCYVSGGSVN